MALSIFTLLLNFKTLTKMSPSASLPSAMKEPLGTVQWSEVVNSVPENSPQHRQGTPSVFSIGSRAPARHSSAAFLLPSKWESDLEKLHAFHKPQKHTGEGQASAWLPQPLRSCRGRSQWTSSWITGEPELYILARISRDSQAGCSKCSLAFLHRWTHLYIHAQAHSQTLSSHCVLEELFS